MRRKRNMSQMKEHDKITTRELNKTEISNMPKGEFKVMVIKILTGLEKAVDELSENFNKDMESIKKNQSELKN